MSFGGQTITFVSLTQTGTEDALGEFPLAETSVVAVGCRHRPATFKETAELNIDVATKIWKSTVPLFEYTDALVDSLKAIENNDRIEVDGETYQIIGGVKPFPDMPGEDFKMTIFSQIQRG